MANLLTGLRLLLSLPVAWAFARPEFISSFLLLTLIVVAILTDYFDGIVARSTNTASARGQLFDHTTDFIFVTSGLFGAAIAGQITIVLPFLIVLAFFQYVMDSYFLYREKQLRMSFLGRWNGVFYFAPLLIVAIARLDFLSAIADLIFLLALVLSYLLVLSTAVSIVDRTIAPLRVKKTAA